MSTLLTVPQKSHWKKRWVGTAAIVAALALVIGAAVLATHWPFTRKAIEKDLEQLSGRDIRIQQFHQTYFPPGCVLEGVTFRVSPPSGTESLVSIQKLTVEGSYSGMVTVPKRLQQIAADGLRVRILPSHRSAQPAQPAQQAAPQKKPVWIGNIQANGAVLQVDRSNGSVPLVFAFRQLQLTSFAADQGTSFHAIFNNPEPPGVIDATGRLGAWQSKALGSIPIEGSYNLLKANLGVFHGIAGTLASKGEFKGEIGRALIQGTTGMPDFELTTNHHPMPLSTRFTAWVNGLNGDTNVTAIQAVLQKTRITAIGSVAGEAGKTITLNANTGEGRIEDLVMLFAKSPRSALVGDIHFKAKAALPPEHRKFEERVLLEGDFFIPEAAFTSKKTQGNVDQLSERSRGEDSDDGDPGQVKAQIKGHVTLRNGTATFSDSTFSVPGAIALLHGTYNLESHGVDLKGTLKMEAKLSQATSGLKSLLARFLNHRFETKDAGATLPVTVKGTYEHPIFHVDLDGKPPKK
jgi:hypothetical protein